MIRILCLHGKNQNATTMHTDLSELDDRLWKNHQIELVYVTGLITPSSYSSTSNVNTTNHCEGDESNKSLLQEEQSSLHSSHRQWFHEPSHVGIDASIFHIEQIWNRELYNRPFHGIIAHHQSAALVSYMMTTSESRDVELLQGCEFVVFIGASTSLPSPQNIPHCVDDNNDNNDIQIDTIDTLHLIPSSSIDCTIHSDAYSIAKQFTYAQIETIDISGGSFSSSANNYHLSALLLPNSNRIFNTIGKFILQCKHKILEQQQQQMTSSLLMQQQDELRLTQIMQESTNLLLQEIHNNPPRSLMAVIAPNVVGGWTGDSKRNDGIGKNDGGGAPCPSEFLLRAQDRAE